MIKHKRTPLNMPYNPNKIIILMAGRIHVHPRLDTAAGVCDAPVFCQLEVGQKLGHPAALYSSQSINRYSVIHDGIVSNENGNQALTKADGDARPWKIGVTTLQLPYLAVILGICSEFMEVDLTCFYT